MIEKTKSYQISSMKLCGEVQDLVVFHSFLLFIGSNMQTILYVRAYHHPFLTAPFSLKALIFFRKKGHYIEMVEVLRFQY